MPANEQTGITASQDSPITVVGLGQCGSNVTLALSLAIDPLVIDVTGDFCTKWNERESTWRKSGSCQSRGTSQSRS
jgi:hypothetical protein